jgi:hypothetical protein
MNPPLHTVASLKGAHLRAYQAIFHHPAAHNLAWHDVLALLRQVAEVAEEPNGNLRVTRNKQTLVLHPHRTKEVNSTEELLDLRHFFERSELAPEPAPAPDVTAGTDAHWLLVIDHRDARIFRSEMHGAAPHKILPHPPHEHFRHTHHSRDFSRGQAKPDPNSFFEPVAKALASGGSILVFGTGTGTSSEMDQFIEWVESHHPELAQRIIGTLVVDENHLTEDQLLAKAREFYTGPRTALV